MNETIAPKLIHTKGPWKVIGRRINAYAGCVGTVRDKGSDTVGNASLMAAAPEILEALQRLVYFHDTDDTPCTDIWESARKAISKATV